MIKPVPDLPKNRYPSQKKTSKAKSTKNNNEALVKKPAKEAQALNVAEKTPASVNLVMSKLDDLITLADNLSTEIQVKLSPILLPNSSKESKYREAHDRSSMPPLYNELDVKLDAVHNFLLSIHYCLERVDL